LKKKTTIPWKITRGTRGN